MSGGDVRCARAARRWRRYLVNYLSTCVVVATTMVAVLCAPSLASAAPISSEDGYTAPSTPGELVASPAASGFGEIAPYSKEPGETGPYAVCPPPTATRPSCGVIGVPKPSSLRALGLPAPSLEGSGKSGGFSPADLRSAYKLPSEGGEGQTVGITVAYDDPNAESDLAKYREEYGLPACTIATGCFKKINQKGEEGSYPTPNFVWATEASLDVDMVSAVCPRCHIILVETDSPETLEPAGEVAVKMGATVLSNSWGTTVEYSGETTENHYFNHPGVPTLFATGDYGYGVAYPASSPDVIAVGGTSLTKAANTRGWSESAWVGAGSGCSKYQSKPVWEKDAGCPNRSVADVSAVADSNTPVSIYDTYVRSGWELVGGTSAATPIVAGVEAVSTAAFRAAGPSAFPYAGQGGTLFDPVEGENGLCGTYLCNGETGYDGPTGWGTPDGPMALPVAVTEKTTVASTSKATLYGSVRPGGLETKYRFEYGETTSYGTNVPIPDKSVGSGSEYAEVSQVIEGLKGHTAYHYRITATNAEGTSHGVDRVFGTTPPAVTTGAASEVHIYRATVSGTINPEGMEAFYFFEYGPTTTYGNRMPLRAKAAGSGSTVVEVSTVLEELKANTAYHYRIGATNILGTAYGADKTLTTARANWRADLLPAPAESGNSREGYGISCVRSDKCVAAGSNYRKGVYNAYVPMIETWNGTTWSATTTPVPPGLEGGGSHSRYGALYAVSCSSETDCIAVGAVRDTTEAIAPLSDHWNGTKWEELSTPRPSGATEGELRGVSCASSTACEAVGRYRNSSGVLVTMIEKWDGAKWGIQTSPNPSGATRSELRGVSCTGSTQCSAVGFYTGSGEKTMAERWNGSAWVLQTTPNPATSTYTILNGVSCASSTDCMAVGGFIKAGAGVQTPLVEHWNGSAWVEQSVPLPVGGKGGPLAAVSCTSTTACTAAGLWYHSTPFIPGRQTLVERWAGSAWAPLETPELAVPEGWWHETFLKSLACTEAEVCFGVGSSLGAPKGELSTELAFVERTLGPSKVTAEAATSITPLQATLNGSVNPNGAETTFAFEYGLTTSYGSKTAEEAAGASMSSAKKSKSITGLAPGTIYHYRLVATNVFGTTPGSDATFTTTVPTWKVTSAPNPAGTLNSYLLGVSCLTSECTSVGDYSVKSGTAAPLAERWNGTEWKIQTTPNPPGTENAQLDSVSCASSTACTAVGYFENTSGVYLSVSESWNGTEWKIQPTAEPSGALNSLLSDVSCTSPSECTAIGWYENSSGVEVPWAERWNGTSWSLQVLPAPSGAQVTFPYGVSCTSATFCALVGLYRDSSGVYQRLAEGWNGSAWSLQSIPPPPSGTGTLTDVSCTTSTACTAGGYYFKTASSTDEPFAERWNGTAWSVQAMPEPGGTTENYVFGVSCVSATVCISGGVSRTTAGKFVSFAEAWNGTGWEVQSTPNNAEGEGRFSGGVSCSSVTNCAGVGNTGKAFAELYR
jgi:Subtilase family